MGSRKKKERCASKRSGQVVLHVVENESTHRMLTAEDISPDGALALLEQRMRERFASSLALYGQRVAPERVKMASYELTSEQRALELERQSEWRTPGFRGATVGDFMGWTCVPYLLIGTTFFVHWRNLNSLDEQQLERFLSDHLEPAVKQLPRGSAIGVIEVEPNRLDALPEGMA